MSFDNDYPNRKDHRRPFFRSARFDRSCRHGGNCSYCRDNRLHHVRRQEQPLTLKEELENDD